MLHRVIVSHKRPACKSTFLLLGALALMLLPKALIAQDKIHKTDKSVIDAKVLEISTSEIKYKKFSNPNGPAYIIPKLEVSMIVYENGEKEVYNTVQNSEKQVQILQGTGIVNRESTAGNPITIEKARNFILNENINEAIASYAILLNTGEYNALLLAEDAYALALGGIYDAALMRLDQCRKLGANTPEINFFTAQIFGLMGNNDLAGEFWKPSAKNIAPAWISSSSDILLQKYRCKFPVLATKNREQLIADFKHANELCAQNLYFQSIALFHDIVSIYPDEYLPYVGYSITLEKAGAYGKSVQSLEKAISLIGNSTEDKTKKQLLEKRLATLKQNMVSEKPLSVPDYALRKDTDASRPQMMAYAGGMLAPSLTSLNCRIGYFVSGASNAALDIGMLKTAETSYSNIGLSIYSQKNGFVSGAGLLMNSASGNTNLSFKLSVGYSKMNKTRTSSFDIFVDVNRGFKKDAITTARLSVGTSFYFGKRK